MTEPDTSEVQVYLDANPSPIGIYRPPARFELDTTLLADGPHELRVEAIDQAGSRGVRRISFEVRNGPGIAVAGLRSGDVVQGRLSVLVNAFGPAYATTWEPGRAETPAPIPTWAWVLSLSVVAWAMFYAARQWNPTPEFAASPTYAAWGQGGAPGPAVLDGGGAGATLYRTSCANCHQSNGEGVPGAFPSLAGDPVVTAQDPTEHVAIVLFGESGKPIGAVTYGGQMPAWGEQLSDVEIAAIVNHERTSWGNSAPTVSTDAVATVRTKGRSAR
jgi:mono/diheme cytochrome c family protein